MTETKALLPLPEVDFVKTARECAANKAIVEGRRGGQITYDYQIVNAYATHLATFERAGYEVGYHLKDISGSGIINPLRIPKSVFKAKTRGDFGKVFADAWQQGLVPTAEQIEARKAAEAERKIAQEKYMAEQAVKQRKEDAAEELYLAASSARTLLCRAQHSELPVPAAADIKAAIELLWAAINLADGGKVTASEQSKIKTLDELEAENPDGFRNPQEPDDEFMARQW